jgi:hypothetical protein
MRCPGAANSRFFVDENAGARGS